MNKVFLLLSGLLTLAGCASYDNRHGAVEKWHNFSETQDSVKVSKRQAEAVFLRPKDVLSGPAVNVFVDGHYLVSLLDGGYRNVALCAGDQRLISAFTNVRTQYHEKLQGEMYRFSPDSVRYFAVVDNGQGKPAIQQLDTESAKAMLREMKPQEGGLSRAQETKCQAAQLQLPIKASVLFQYDKYRSQDVVADGLSELAMIAGYFKEAADSSYRIHVQGYTDPMGKAAYNRQLSLERAQIVKNHLVKLGVPEGAIDVAAQGASDFVVGDCAKRFANKEQRDACNLPNRRAVVTLHDNQK